ncbi:MAG: cytochrome c [Deferribacteraceae bacterium]|nr:cytochrome c [Deferribacteraceae bacterium]
MKKLIFIIALFTMVFSVAAFAGANALVDQRCGSCHDTARVYNKKTDKAGWDAVMARMVKRGMKISEDEYKQISEYLYTM